MTTSDFTTAIIVDKPAKKVFDAINNVRGWWHGKIEGHTGKVNDEFTYRWEDVHYSKQKITTLIPGEKIVWLVTDSKLTFTNDQSEWTGTEIIFDLSKVDGGTQVRFTHRGLVPALECFGACSNGWDQLIHKSLYGLITTGQGTSVF